MVYYFTQSHVQFDDKSLEADRKNHINSLEAQFDRFTHEYKHSLLLVEFSTIFVHYFPPVYRRKIAYMYHALFPTKL